MKGELRKYYNDYWRTIPEETAMKELEYLTNPKRKYPVTKKQILAHYRRGTIGNMIYRREEILKIPQKINLQKKKF